MIARLPYRRFMIPSDLELPLVKVNRELDVAIELVERLRPGVAMTEDHLHKILVSLKACKDSNGVNLGNVNRIAGFTLKVEDPLLKNITDRENDLARREREFNSKTLSGPVRGSGFSYPLNPNLTPEQRKIYEDRLAAGGDLTPEDRAALEKLAHGVPTNPASKEIGETQAARKKAIGEGKPGSSDPLEF